MKLLIKNLGGLCPVQGEGTLEDKWNWYFRARGDHWEFYLEPAGIEPLAHWFDVKQTHFYYQDSYGTPHGFDAGYMPLGEAVGFIGKACEEFLEKEGLLGT